jgi:hypothetical protein
MYEAAIRGVKLVLWFALVLLVGVTIGLVWIAGTVLLDLHDTRSQLKPMLANIDGAVSDERAAVAQLKAFLQSPYIAQKAHDYDQATISTIRAVSSTANQLRHASADERAQLKDQNDKITAVVTTLATAIKNTDDSLNRQVLPATTAAVQATAKMATDTTKSIADTSAAFLPVIQHFDAMVSDPAIKESIGNLDKSSASLAVASQNTAEITALGVKEMKQLTAPVTKLRAFTMTFLSGLGHLLGL